MNSSAAPSHQVRIDFYATPPHECSYLPHRIATTLFADPFKPMSMAAYSALADLGFRRSGGYVYRPHCEGCDACKAARIPVAEFRPNRSQRRNLARNRDLRVIQRPMAFDLEHFDLYRRYTSTRHVGGGMDGEDVTQYRRFLFTDWAEGGLVEFREGDRLVCVAVVDYLQEGLSAVYTFYDPALPSLGLGTYAVLWQIAEAERRGLPWVYLGYWIGESRKMAYKSRYRPLEIFDGGRWVRLGEPSQPPAAPIDLPSRPGAAPTGVVGRLGDKPVGAPPGRELPNEAAGGSD